MRLRTYRQCATGCRPIVQGGIDRSRYWDRIRSNGCFAHNRRRTQNSDRAVRRYEGYVVQSTGDGIFALFGAPAAYEDHPQRALYAALQMQRELRAHGQRRGAQGRPALEARIGVNSGEVVVRTVETGGKVEYTPIGHTANLASRLQTVAPAGSIAVSEHTQQLVEGYFELRPLGPAEIKGIS